MCKIYVDLYYGSKNVPQANGYSSFSVTDIRILPHKSTSFSRLSAHINQFFCVSFDHPSTYKHTGLVFGTWLNISIIISNIFLYRCSVSPSHQLGYNSVSIDISSSSISLYSRINLCILIMMKSKRTLSFCLLIFSGEIRLKHILGCLFCIAVLVCLLFSLLDRIEINFYFELKSICFVDIFIYTPIGQRALNQGEY